MTEKATFIDKYVDEAVAQLAPLVGRPLTDGERERIRAAARERAQDRPALIVNPYRNMRVPTTVGKIADFIVGGRKHAPIITGHGTLFKPHEEHDSVIGAMVKMLMDKRKIEKNAMFDLMRAGRSPDDPEVKAKDQAQKIFKLLANSYYGAMGEKGFHFYDPQNGPATTYNGQLIISSTLYGFESFMANNLWLKDTHELTRHVAYCLAAVDGGPALEEEWGEADSALFEPAAVVDHLLAACAPGWDARPAAELLVSRLDGAGLRALALRGNPTAFCALPRCMELLETALGGEIAEADPGKIAKHHPAGKAAIEELFAGMRRWVMVPHVPGDLPRRVGEMERQIVVLTDTDSTFLNLGPWMEFLRGAFDLSAATEGELLTALNVAVYFLRLFNDVQMAALTEALNIPAPKRGLINFKSEFVIKRMVLTDGKKHYAALLRFQEGARIEGDKVELKGLAMKKTTVAKGTGKHFERAIEHRVLRPDEVDRVGLVRDVVELEAKIRRATEEGSAEYSTPAVLGRFESYAEPYSMPVVRGTAAWNAAMPDTPIRDGDRVNSFRIRIGTDAGKMADEIAKWPEGSEERVALEAIAKKFFDPLASEGLAKNGFNWLAVPKEVSRVPVWARPLIDLGEVIQANTSPVLPILQSIGVAPLRRPDPEIYSNCVNF